MRQNRQEMIKCRNCAWTSHVTISSLQGRIEMNDFVDDESFQLFYFLSFLDFCGFAAGMNKEPNLSSTTTRAAISRTNPSRSLELALAAARVAAENKGQDVLVLDMTQHTALFDYFVIATGTSRRQLHAISEDIDDCLEKDMGDKRMNIAGYDESRWIVLDYGTVVIHLFDADKRAFYSLENLWADAKEFDISDILEKARM